jgi:hypothetical protein
VGGMWKGMQKFVIYTIFEILMTENIHNSEYHGKMRNLEGEISCKAGI